MPITLFIPIGSSINLIIGLYALNVILATSLFDNSIAFLNMALLFLPGS